jgi:hypothetical protein
MELSEAVDDYIRTRRASARADLEEFRKLPSLNLAIRHAALCHWLPELKRHPHQYRIPLSLLKAVERKLHRMASVLAHTPSFNALYNAIHEQIAHMRGIGPLTVYDIAHRIGAFLGKTPTLVYLHRGTRVGARRLGFTGNTLDPASLPTAFARLTPAEIEDCLCIYYDHFRPRQTRAPHNRRRLACVGLSIPRVRKC